MTPAIAVFVAITLTISAACIGVRVRVFWRNRAARNRQIWYAAKAAAEHDPGRRAAWQILARLDADAEHTGPRLRLAVAVFPRPALLLAAVPRPDCGDCHGEGGWAEDYGHPETGEWDGEQHVVCACWDPGRSRTLLPLPLWVGRWLRRREPDPEWPLSSEPPF